MGFLLRDWSTQKKVDLKENIHGKNFEQKCDLGEIGGFDLGMGI